jgi:hypothetical protein
MGAPDRNQEKFVDGIDDWLFLMKIKPAKRAVSFNVLLIMGDCGAAFR